jgi:hypothetical protein
MAVTRQALEEITDRSAALRAHLEGFQAHIHQPQNKHGEAPVELTAGHTSKHELAGTFAGYEIAPREYELSVAQTVLQVRTRVADLYNNPMNQIDEQLRLTIEELREHQEHELINNRDFGLHNADLTQRINARTGPPTPDDLDELLSRRRKSRSFTAFRTGVADHGVVGLHQTGIPDEVKPGLNVRFLGINDKTIIPYPVSAYYSAAVLVLDELGILENVEIGRWGRGHRP